MSTTYQTLILTSTLKDKIINYMEVGINCAELLGDLTMGSVYIPESIVEDYWWEDYSKKVKIKYKNVEYYIIMGFLGGFG